MQELVDRPTHFGGFRIQNFGHFGHGRSRLACAFDRFPDAADIFGNPAGSICGFGDIAGYFLCCRALLIDRCCDRSRIAVDFVHRRRNRSDRFDRIFGLGLDR